LRHFFVEGATMDLEHRVARLERENRRLRLAGLLALMLMGVLFVMGQARPVERIEAENFVVRDRRGVALASFGAAYPVGSDVGTPGLWHYIYLPDGRSEIGTMFERFDNGEVYLQLTSSGGRITLDTGIDGGGPSISITDSAGSVWSAP
jgi:hypothetical protein